jgi:hypothetical protein
VNLTEKGREMRADTKPFSDAVQELSGLPENRFRELQGEIVALRDRLLEADSKKG